MNVLSEALALAHPHDGADYAAAAAALEDVRRGRREKEIRIGVGPLDGFVPARVFAYADCVASALRADQAAAHLTDRASRITIFSSAPKSGSTAFGSMLVALVALGGALRLLGIGEPIVLEAASPAQEVPAALRAELPADIKARIDAMAAKHNGTIAYAYEHAAATMFADLDDGQDIAPLRITIGGETEAIFWAVRMHVRKAAMEHAVRIAPALGLILRSVDIPWYYPSPDEPPIAMMQTAAAAADALERAANPRHEGNSGRRGNTGLKKEARALRRVAKHPPNGLAEYIDALATVEGAMHFTEQMNLTIGPRMCAGLGGVK
jgi:hypothetical protein